jgi:hypothetical protein
MAWKLGHRMKVKDISTLENKMIISRDTPT